jgi:hypothetical protein
MPQYHYWSTTFRRKTAPYGGNAGVVSMGKAEQWHKRHALNVVAQLPENVSDALQILECAKELVENFLIEAERPPIAASGGAAGGLRLVQSTVQLDAKPIPIGIPEPIDRQPRRPFDE